MKGGDNRSQGFTIIEVLIVLAITALMLLGAFTLVGGKQDQSEFDLSIQDVKAQIQQNINGISQGSYDLPANSGCDVIGPLIYPTLLSAPTPVGTTQLQLCDYLGNAIHFYEASSNPNTYATVYPVMGRACSYSLYLTNPTVCSPVQSLSDALPIAAAQSTGGAYDAGNTQDWTSTMQFQNGALKVGSMNSVDSNGNPIAICSMAFIQDPAITINGGNIVSTAGALNLYAIYDTDNNCDPAATGQSKADAAYEIDCNLQTLEKHGTPLNCDPVINNPNAVPQVTICFVSNVTQQSGLVTITANTESSNPSNVNYAGRSLSVSLSIYGDTTCT